MSLFPQEESKTHFIKYGILAGFLESWYIFILIMTGNLLSDYFEQHHDQQILIPILFLLVFVFSAAISALLVLGYPAYLFLIEKKLKEAVITVVSALSTLVILGILVFVLIII